MFKQLNYLNVGQNPQIGDRGVQYLIEGEYAFPNLESLKMRKINISDEGFNHLIKKNKKNKMFKSSYSFIFENYLATWI